jgi:hypothetical protein
MSKQVTEAEQKKIDEAAADKLKAEQEEAEAKEKKYADEAAAALSALGVGDGKAEKAEQKPKSNLDMLREQQMINEQINYQAAKVKGQTFVRGK